MLAKRTRSVLRWSIAVALVMVIVVFRLVEETEDNFLAESRFRIVKIIDGDTVELEGGDRLRLKYIDAPERGDPFGDSATALLKLLTYGRVAQVNFGARRRDGYGRLLAELSVQGQNISEELLRRGFANVYLFRDRGGNMEDSLVERLIAVQTKAVLRRAGMWAIERVEEDEYVSPASSLRFHRPGCSSIRRTNTDKARHYESRFEALVEGLSPCRNCRP